MNCDECKEQIFELIEREAVDPEAVRRILARCPDCRSEFEQTKASLALANHLPIEAPRPAVDAAILRAASRRPRPVLSVRKRRAQPLPWAAAAIALLAVGVGVMAIPRGGQRGDEQVAVENEVASARPATEPAEAPRVEPAPAKSMLRAASPAPAKRQAKRAADELKVERTGGAPSPRLVAREAAGPAAEADFAPSPGGEQARAESVEASCRRQIEALERRKRDAQAAAIEPEEELAIGKCYQALGNLAGARKWLRRAARHPETRARAEEALHQLAPQ